MLNFVSGQNAAKNHIKVFPAPNPILSEYDFTPAPLIENAFLYYNKNYMCYAISCFHHSLII